MSNPEDLLKEIAAAAAVCTRCPLHNSREHSVPGEGPAQADLMFIGEGPGYHENKTGRPFVGAAGKFLDELLASIGLDRSKVFITNVVKCRPPNNRDPLPEELAACDAYLQQQIAAINPKVIVTLGRFSMAKFLPGVKISAVHGKPKRVDGRLVVPMFHPAAALHQGNLKPVVQQDFSKLPRFIEFEYNRLAEKQAEYVVQPPEPVAPAQDDDESKQPPQQLRMF